MKKDAQALKIAAEIIGRDFGTLDDLPAELADTIANIYYKFCLLPFGDIAAPSKGGIADDIANFMKMSAEWTADVQLLPDLVKQLREMRQSGRKELYDYSIRYILDEIKYKIPNARDKSELRRRVERLFRKTNEIAGLYQMMRQECSGNRALNS